MLETSSSDTSMKFSPLVLIPPPKMVLLNELAILSPMVSKVAWLVLASPLLTGPLLYFMSYELETHFLETVKACLLFIFQLERKTTSRILVLLAVKFGSALQESKQRGSKIKLEKESSLVMFLTPHKISSGMILNLNDVKLLYIVYLTKDSMTSLLSLFVPMHSICFVSQMEMISLKSKVLSMLHLTCNSISTPSQKSKLLLFMDHLLRTILHLVLKWKQMSILNESTSATLQQRFSSASAKSTALSIYKSKKGLQK